jgi:hypothetical protein
MTKATSSSAHRWTAEVRHDGSYRVVEDDCIVIANQCVREDALLIAAAPDLFKACQVGADFIARVQYVRDELQLPSYPELTMLMRAMGKATGCRPW